MNHLKKKKGRQSIRQHILCSETNRAIMQAYKRTRANIVFALQEEKNKQIMIASAVGGEGKTTSCFNLGICLAQMPAKVLIIDCDLRKPCINKIVGMSNEQGLAELLEGKCLLEDVIKRTVYAQLDILPSGIGSLSPTELLGSTMMQALLLKLSEIYEYILLDTPAINVVVDAVLLASHVTATVLVVREGYSKHEDIQEAIQELERAKANIVGVIVNDTKQKLSHKSYDKCYETYKEALF